MWLPYIPGHQSPLRDFLSPADNKGRASEVNQECTSLPPQAPGPQHGHMVASHCTAPGLSPSDKETGFAECSPVCHSPPFCSTPSQGLSSLSPSQEGEWRPRQSLHSQTSPSSLDGAGWAAPGSEDELFATPKFSWGWLSCSSLSHCYPQDSY